MCHRHVVNVIYVVCRSATLILLLCWSVCFLYILSFYGLPMRHAFSQPLKEISLELTLIVVINSSLSGNFAVIYFVVLFCLNCVQLNCLRTA